MSDAVTLRGMRFHALIGILPHEREIPQPLEVDLTVWLAADIPSRDESADHIVDYRALYDLTAAEINDRHNGYIEHLALRIADRALADARIARCEVIVRKPGVALPGPLAGAEVRVERSRRA